MNDPLITQLRDQAKQFDPQPPTTLRRRLLSALALAPTPRADHRLRLRRTLATIAAAILIALAFFEFRPHPPAAPVVQTPQSRPGSTRSAVAAALTYPTGNPIALAQRWVEQPLQNQVNTFIDHLTSARDTLQSPFPSPIKRPRPADPL